MTHSLEYAQPDVQSSKRRRGGWIACIVSIVISLGTGLESIRLAIYFTKPITGSSGGGRSPYWFIDKQVNLIGAPILLCIALIACCVCWRRKTGKWWSVIAVLVGLACWIGAVSTYP